MQKTQSRAVMVAGVVLAVAGACLALFVAMQKTSRWQQAALRMPDYIFDRTFVVNLEELSSAKKIAEKLKAAGQQEKMQDDCKEINPAEYMTEDFGVNAATLSYFHYLDALFATSSDLPSHLEGVKKLLFGCLPAENAAKVYAVYEKYLTCELELANMISAKKEPKTPAQIVLLLAEAQNFRREYLGRDLADALFGADVKALEYAVRRGAIVSDNTLHGKEKEELVKKLTLDMWGDQAEAIERFSQPFNRYLEKLRMYSLDMNELKTEKEKAALLKEIRSSCFPPEVVLQLENIDRQHAEMERAGGDNLKE